jgi:hypothetical protein
MQPLTLRDLRAHAVARSLGVERGLLETISALGFVQYDPIRAPARAADLILRQRVSGYRAGDLDRAYPALPLAEEYIHVYGVVPLAVQRWLHPRVRSHRMQVEREHPRLAARILAHVGANGETHPRDLATALGRTRTTSGWGGQSAATTRMLEALHHRGHLRVARRVAGIKVYAAASDPRPPLAPVTRARQILKLLLDLYAPLPESSFRQLARMVSESSLPREQRDDAYARLRAGSHVRRVVVDGTTWLLPAAEAILRDTVDRVRLLAPFDPIVWDRRRFAAFWSWDYRFEAYTPPARRKLGYYALPLLWRDDVIGWANARVRGDALVVDVGYAKAAPRSIMYRRELDAELARLATFMGATRVAREAVPPARGGADVRLNR